jgi:iron complex outermembrane receptor protein
LAGQHSWTPHFHGLVSASVLDAKFTQDYSYLSSASTTATVSNGNKLPGIPQHFVFTELLWTSQPRALLSRSASYRRLGGTQAGLEWVSAGSLYANDTNSASAEGYNTLHFKLNQVWMLEKSRLTAYGRVDNLTDQRYVGSVIVNQSSSQFYEPAPGTQWSIGVRWNVPL